ncbi:MAG: hypothetical protein IT435_04320 [Phycisphaerales bacterium]|nr:hypothetical protein [Phycisphaerales bacterium]
MDPRTLILRQKLFEFGEGEWWRIADAVEGTGVLGATGSGKSTGPASLVFGSMLRNRFGGLLLTAKPEDPWTIANTYFRNTGRDPREDLVFVQPDDPHPSARWPKDLLGPYRALALNVLQYEYERGGGLTSNVVDVLHAGTTPYGSEARTDQFWIDAYMELIRNAVELSVMASILTSGNAQVRLDDILDIVRSAPVSLQDVNSTRFRGGRCCALLQLADLGRAKLTEPRFRDWQLTADYWLRHLPSLAEETRTSITATFTSKVDGLLRSPLRELLCGRSDEAAMPERSLEPDPVTGRPKVIVLNIPVKLYHNVGRMAQTLYKTIWQRAAERRAAAIDAGDTTWCPAFLGADECQYFVTYQDALFQQAARSAMVATVYLTQNLPNLYAEVGEHATHSLLGNLQTKVFLAQGDPVTNEWAERVFASEIRGFRSEPITGEGSSSVSYSYAPLIPAIRFTELKKGGWHDDPAQTGRVGSYIFQAGRQWKTKSADRHYHEFEQGA